MVTKEYKSGALLIQREQPITALHVIAKGSVRASYPGGEFYLNKGDVIGACEAYYDSHFITYQAVEDISIASYACGSAARPKLMRSREMSNLIISSLFRQVREILDQYELTKFDSENFYQYLMDNYSDYVNFCAKIHMTPRDLPGLENVTEFKLEEDIGAWMSAYYEQMQKFLDAKMLLSSDPDFLLGVMIKANEDVYNIISVCRALHDYKSEITHLLMNENHLDFFDLYAGLLYKVGPNAENSTSIIAAISTMMIQLEGQDSIDQDMYRLRVDEYKEKLQSVTEYLENHPEGEEEHSDADKPKEIVGSLDTILAYAECGEELSSEFRNAIEQYKKLPDKNSTDDSARKLRLTITKLFYQVYEKAFLKSLTDYNIPKILYMFFNFGYVDEHLAGMDTAVYLYSIAKETPSDPGRNVYTIYEWLRAIYDGRKTPSRNEFDNDYVAYVHELKMTGKISPGEETNMLNDKKQQVCFELQNMFTSVNKISFGRISTFCPVFSEHNVLKELPNSLVSADRVQESINRIRSTDFSAFYRETVYTNPDIGIGKEYISVEILPDVVLMPNVGIRGVMWQEIEGRKRTTPARMMVSIFQMEDLDSLLVRMTGEYRWEMCKRVQGARWNDVSEPSLTSEYFDYIQFYKKNRDLSADAKDKIKLAMQKAKNSFKEMFIRDYSSWILYEGTGSPRLNKIARTILFSYCPFSKEIREKLKANPLYKEMMDRYDIKLGQKIHHMNNLLQKLKNSNATIPEEIEKQRKYLTL